MSRGSANLCCRIWWRLSSRRRWCICVEKCVYKYIDFHILVWNGEPQALGTKKKPSHSLLFDKQVSLCWSWFAKIDIFCWGSYTSTLFLSLPRQDGSLVQAKPRWWKCKELIQSNLELRWSWRSSPSSAVFLTIHYRRPQSPDLLSVVRQCVCQKLGTLL